MNEWEQKYNTVKNEESSLKTAYEQAITTAEGKLDTYNQKVRSKEDTVRNNDSTVSTKKDNLETSRLNAATSGLSDKQQIEQYEKQIEACTITAPISGIVTECNVEVGDIYSGAAIVTIEDISNYEISSEIDEYDISQVKVGQKVVIKPNGTGDAELDGTVKEIAPRATVGGSDVTYKVVISIDTPSEELKMDMTAKLSIILESKEDVLTVPYDSVQEDEEGNFYIETLKEVTGQTETGMEPSGMKPDQNRTGMVRETEKVIITKGIESDYYVEVIGNGIKEGMTVIVPSSENGNKSEIKNWKTERFCIIN